MKTVAKLVVSACVRLLAVLALGPSSTAYGGDGQASWQAAPGSRTVDAAPQSVLRVVQPRPLAMPGPVYRTAQAPLLPPRPADAGPAITPGPTVEPLPAIAPPAPMQPLPPTGRGAEDVDASWKPIGAIGVAITLPQGDFPTDEAAPRFIDAGVINYPAAESRNWAETSYFWLASSFCCGPLYFEEPNLERYGYKVTFFQPGLSAAHFFATIPLLPYKMVVHPPHECVYTLGYYRPGDCAPLQHERFHFEADAAAAEVGAVMGMILLLH